MSAGIDFVIGGKDKAGPAMDSVEKSLHRLEQKTDKLGSATKKLTAVTGALAAAYGAVKAGLAILGGIDQVNAAYDKQIDAVKGLEIALSLQGEAVDGQSSKLQTFASDMQKLTGVGDEVTLGLMKQASMLGVNADQLDDAAKAAIGLSEATGKSLDESIKIVNNSLAGEFGALGEVIPAIRQMTTEEEKLAAVLDLSRKGLEAKTAASNTVAGMTDRASGAIGDLMESVGALLAPVRLLIAQGLTTLAESLQSVLAPAVAMATSMLENMGPMLDWVKEKVVQGVNIMIGAFTFFEVVIGNLDKIWAAMVAQAELYFLQMQGVVMHVLTSVIPQYAAWFARNFVNLISDGMQLAVTVVTNHVRKLIDTFQALWNFIASGGQSDVLGQLGEIAGRSYLEGFQSSVESLPEIASRKISEREKQLQLQIGQIGMELGAEFTTKFNERMVGLGDGLSDEFSKDIDLKVTKSIDDKLGQGVSGSGGGSAQLTAKESRLLTRGPAEQRKTLVDALEELIIVNRDMADSMARQEDLMSGVESNTSNTTQLVPTS